MEFNCNLVQVNIDKIIINLIRRWMWTFNATFDIRLINTFTILQSAYRPSQVTSGSWRLSRPHTINTYPSSFLRHRTAGGWGSATSVWWRRRTSPWPIPGPNVTKGMKLLPNAATGTRCFLNTGDYFPPAISRSNANCIRPTLRIPHRDF